MERTLGSFLKALDRAGELHRFGDKVSPILEISEVADRHSKSACPSISAAARRFDPLHADRGGKALMFENVAGCDFPLAINVYGSYSRTEMALGCNGPSANGFESIATRIASLSRLQPPRSFGEALHKAREFLPLLRIAPRLIRRGICQEIIRLTSRGEVDLTRLPLIKCWPLDGDPAAVGYNMTATQAGTAAGQGRYITFAGMHTIHYEDRDAAKPASHNIGMYRAQLIDQTHLAMHWHMHHDGAAHWRSWKQAGQPMPIAICLGGESVLPYAATAPLPPGISELLMAGFLNGRGIPMVKAKTVPLRVPANSEIIIEGWVSTECGLIGYDPRRGEPLGPGAVFEGPFGDHTGFYSLPDRYPIVNVTAITHRRDAIFPAIIVGLPPQEDYYLGKATERIFLPLLKTIIHDVDDYHLPMFGCFHNCAFVRIRKAYPLQARRVMHAIWGAGQMSWTKFIIVVDEAVDVHDEVAVLRAMFQYCDFKRDIELVNGPLDILDHAAPRLGAGSKIGIDATRKIAGEEVNGVPISADSAFVSPGDRNPWTAAAGAVCPEFGGGRCVFVGVQKRQPGEGIAAIERVWRHAPAGTADFVIAVDSSIDLADWQSVLFHLCANTDPGRDLVAGQSANQPPSHRIAFDATPKMKGDERCGQLVRDYPPVLVMSEDIKQRIDARRAEFGLPPD